MNALERDEWETCKHEAVSISQELAAAIAQVSANPALTGIYLQKAQARASALYQRMEDWPHEESRMTKAGGPKRRGSR